MRTTATIFLILFSTAVAGADTLYENGDGSTRLTVSANVMGAVFSTHDPWFGESESFIGADVDQWAELGLEPSFNFETAVGNGVLFAELSGVFTTTFNDDASGLTIGLNDTRAFKTEQAHIGWRVDDVFSGLEGDTFSIIAGRQDYSIGTGLQVNDGSSDGAELGGWYLGMRKAFAESILLRLDSDRWLFEASHMENQPRRGGITGSGSGINLEHKFNDSLLLGGSYLYIDSNIGTVGRYNVYSARAEVQPVSSLTLSGEYVTQHGDLQNAQGFFADLRYSFGSAESRSPTLTYRFSRFDGDSPGTGTNEDFRMVAYGFTDYSYWFQGEITSGYILGNDNLQSHMLRLQAQPHEDVSLNIFYYDFTLDEPTSLAPNVQSDDWGDELNLIVDWQVSDSLSLNTVLGALIPGDAAQQWTGGDDTWAHFMLLMSYSW